MIAASAFKVCVWGPHPLGSQDWCPECQTAIENAAREKFEAERKTAKERWARFRAERPEVFAFADALREQQPSWAEAEDCEVIASMVDAALKACGLRLLPQDD